MLAFSASMKSGYKGACHLETLNKNHCTMWVSNTWDQEEEDWQMKVKQLKMLQLATG